MAKADRSFFDKCTQCAARLKTLADHSEASVFITCLATTTFRYWIIGGLSRDEVRRRAGLMYDEIKKEKG